MEERGVPRVFDSVETEFGGDLGRAATQQLFGGGLTEPLGPIDYHPAPQPSSNHDFSRGISIFYLKTQFPRVETNNPVLLSPIIAWQGCDDPIGSPR